MVEHQQVTSSLGLLAFCLVGAVFIAGAVWAAVQQSKKRQALMAFCQSQGWTYTREDGSLVGRWQGAPFGRGESRRVTDVVRGVREQRPFTAFNYQFVERHSDGKGGSTTTTYRYAVVALGLPAFLPTVEVVPDNLFTRAAAAIGLSPGIELESEDFNRKFRVTGRDPKFASDILSPRTMELLLRSPARSWRIEGSDLLSWDNGRIDPVEVLGTLAPLCAVVAGIPTFVWHDHGYDPPGVQEPPMEGSSS